MSTSCTQDHKETFRRVVEFIRHICTVQECMYEQKDHVARAKELLGTIQHPSRIVTDIEHAITVWNELPSLRTLSPTTNRSPTTSILQLLRIMSVYIPYDANSMTVFADYLESFPSRIRELYEYYTSTLKEVYAEKKIRYDTHRETFAQNAEPYSVLRSLDENDVTRIDLLLSPISSSRELWLTIYGGVGMSVVNLQTCTRYTISAFTRSNDEKEMEKGQLQLQTESGTIPIHAIQSYIPHILISSILAHTHPKEMQEVETYRKNLWLSNRMGQKTLNIPFLQLHGVKFATDSLLQHILHYHSDRMYMYFMCRKGLEIAP